ncbi:hypothetical protein [Nocardia acidivorans]|uniref:hypothetical protein n=1 Tax=Nocardia acidivorans TaxID=404580 RepID=UPI00248010D7|nr:hypothetical protein [Nocardia acidivorans]
MTRWLGDPLAPPPETRDPAQVKLFFADLGRPDAVVGLARAQAAEHRRRLDLYRTLQAEIDPADSLRAVSRERIPQLGIKHERAYVEFWEELAAHPNGARK